MGYNSSVLWDLRLPFHCCRRACPWLKMGRKNSKRFDIGLYAKFSKTQRINRVNARVRQNEISEPSTNSSTIASNTQNQNIQASQNTVTSPTEISTPTKRIIRRPSCLAEDGDHLLLSKAESSRRRVRTKTMLEAIHGKNKSYVGAWNYVITNREEAQSLLTKSKYATRIKNDRTVNSGIYESAKLLSVKTIYKGGVMSRRKYNALRECQKDGASYSVTKPMLLPYNKVVNHIKSIQFPAVTNFLSISGGYRNLREHILSILQMYISTTSSLEWFGRPNHFQLAFGGDGAPLGTETGAVSFLLSVLNAGSKVNSRDHNHLTCLAGTSDESHPEIVNYLKYVASEFSKLEKESITICDKVYTVSLELLPVDQKFLSIMAGELSNSATYPSTFAVVSAQAMKVLPLTHTWKEWSYDHRIQSVEKLEVFKAKQPDASRSKVTQFIASIHSRQEYTPPMGEYIDKALLDPLHVKNNAWAKLNSYIVDVVMRLSKCSRNQKLTDLQSSDAVKLYIAGMKAIKAGKILKKFLNWFNSDRESSRFVARFTGEDSNKLLSGLQTVISEVLSCSNCSSNTRLQLHVLGYLGTCLAKISIDMCKFNIDDIDLDLFQQSCEKYFTGWTLFFSSGLNEWSVGCVLPRHLKRCIERFGRGLGINSTQGREAKHLAVKSYKTKTSPQTMYSKILVHEFVDCIYLPAQDTSFKSYKGNTSTKLALANNFCLCKGQTFCSCQSAFSLIDQCCTKGCIMKSQLNVMFGNVLV